MSGLGVGEEPVNVLECAETAPGAEPTRFVRATHLELDRCTAPRVAGRGGCGRSKIKNEGPNEQRNSGCELEHAYSEDETAPKNCHVLLQVAQLIELLGRLGSLVVRDLGSGVRELFVLAIPAEALGPGAAARTRIRADPS